MMHNSPNLSLTSQTFSVSWKIPGVLILYVQEHWHKNLPALATDETAHVKCCLYAGIKVLGTNAEVMPAHWEYQVSTVQSTVH